MSDATEEPMSSEPLNLGSQDAADRAERIHRLEAAGIKTMTPASAMAEMVRLFGTGEKTGEDVSVLVDKIEAMDDAELKQVLYVCSAAAQGAQNLGQAVAAVMAKRFFEKQFGEGGGLFGSGAEVDGDEWKDGKPEDGAGK